MGIIVSTYRISSAGTGGFMCLAAALAAWSAQAQSAPDIPAWTTAVESTYTKSRLEEKGQGITQFHACFKQVGKVCTRFAYATHYWRMHLRVFNSGLYYPTDAMTQIRSYVSLAENGKPMVFFQPYYLRRTGWLLMRRMTLTVDGKLLLDQALRTTSATPGDGSENVEEQSDFMLTAEQIDALRKIKPQSTVAVSLIGDKGEVALSPWDIQNFKEDMPNMLFTYDALKAATAKFN